MSEIFNQFGIHPSLLIAQLVNFTVLVFVLYKLVYNPILKILDKRRKTIEDSLAQAKEVEEKMKNLDENIKRIIDESKNESEKLIKNAKEVGEKVRNEMIHNANEEVSLLIEKAKSDAESEKQKMMKEVKEYILKISFAVVTKLLEDKLDDKFKEKFAKESLDEIISKI